MRLQDAVLHGSQRVQGHFLCFGKSLDARDIESLVGPVAPQGAQRLATLYIPDHDSSIIPTAGQLAAIEADLEGLDRPLMGFSLPHARSAGHVPPAQPAITASTDHHLPACSPAQRSHHRWMPRQGMHALPALYLPHEQLPTVPGCPLQRPVGSHRG